MKYIINTIAIILLLIVIAAITVSLLGFRIQSLSERDLQAMYPTLRKGDLFLFKTNYDSTDFRRGDIVLFSDYRFPYPLVRRIIGLENDKIKIDDGKIILNGRVLEEPYKSTISFNNGGKTTKDYNVQYELEITVPPGKVYVAGDNRVLSLDSRDPSFGLINEKEITGHVTTIFFSDHFSKIGTAL